MANNYTKHTVEVFMKTAGMNTANGNVDKFVKKLKDVSATTERNTRGVGEMSSSSTKNFSKMSQGLSGLVHVYASLAANIFAVSAAFRAMSDAADYKRMINASRQLSIETGNNFTAVAKSLKNISLSAIDMQTAMQTANLGLAAGFSGKQLENITKLATQAGIALGRNVPDAISRLTTAIVKGEPELTDELGIILRLKEATEDYAKIRGKAAKDLSTGERLQAVYEQAMERGTPKYGAIEIQAQSFDKLLSSIKDVSKWFLTLANVIVGPFAKALGDNQLLLGAVFIMLGKLLLTKTTHFFGDSFKAKINSVNDSLKEHLRVLRKIRPEYQQTVDSLKEEHMRQIQKGYEKSSSKTIMTKNLSAIYNNAADDPRIGKTLIKNIGGNVLRTFPSLISKAAKKGLSTISFMDASNKFQVMDLALAQETLDVTTQTVKMREYATTLMKAADSGSDKTKSIWNSINAEIKSAGSAVKVGFNSGLLAGMQSSVTTRRQFVLMKRDLQQMGILTKTVAKGTFLIGVAAGKVGAAFNKIGGLLNVLAIAVSAFTLLAGAIKSIPGVWSGNLSKVNDSMDSLQERTDNIKETIATIAVNPRNMQEITGNIKKMANVVSQYGDMMVESFENLGNLQDYSWGEKLLAGSIELEKQTKENVDNIFKYVEKAFDMLPEGVSEDYIEKTFGDRLQGENIQFLEKIVNLGERRKQLEQEILELRSTQQPIPNPVKSLAYRLPFMSKLAVVENAKQIEQNEQINAKITARQAQLDQINNLQEKHKLLNDDTVNIQISLNDKLDDHIDLLKIIRTKNKEGLIDIIERLKLQEQKLESENASREKIDEIRTLAGVLLSLFNDIAVAANDFADALANSERLLNSILSKFGKFQGMSTFAEVEKLTETRRTIQKGIAKGLMGLPDSEKYKEAKKELDKYTAAIKSVQNIYEYEFLEGNKDIVLETTREMADLYDKGQNRTQKKIDRQRREWEDRAKQLLQDNARINVGLKSPDADLRGRGEQLRRQQKENEEHIKLLNIQIDKSKTLEEIKKKTGGSHKSSKFRGNDAQVGLEYLRAIQVVAEQNLKSANTSTAIRVGAAETLLDLEYKMFHVRMSTVEADKKDALENMKKGKDENARSKARLEYAKALTAEATLEAEIKDKVIARQEALMLARAQDGQAGIEMVGFTLRQTFRDLLNDLEAWTVTFSNAIKNVFESTTKSLAEAIVSGENNIAESVSEALKSSAIDLIDKGFQKILLESLPDSFTKVMDPQRLATMNNTAALWANTYSKELAGTMGPPRSLLTGPGNVGDGASSGILSTLFNWGASLLSGVLADGGIMNHVNSHARGTITNGPELALIGEGSRNEAVVPLPDNRSIPVSLNGQTGNNNSNVYININSDGSSELESDVSGQKGKELASVMQIAIKKQLMTEQRPGGLLYTGRR